MLDWIVERKTLQDLMASLHSGRLEDQYHRLVHSRLNIVLLLEQRFYSESAAYTKYLLSHR